MGELLIDFTDSGMSEQCGASYYILFDGGFACHCIAPACTVKELRLS